MKTILLAGLLALVGVQAQAEDAARSVPGVTASEIKVGQTMAYSGPASAYARLGRTETAYFQMLNDQGGINGRKVQLLSYDDAYLPSKTVEQTRKLVEDDGVSFIAGTVGTAHNTAIRKYLNTKGVPQLFLGTGADKWADYKEFPWTMGWMPSYRTEAQVYARYILKEMPTARMAIIVQNDDMGRDYLAGLKDVFGDDWAKRVIKEATFEVADPTIDSQVVSLRASGAEILFTIATPKAGAQVIRKVAEMGWKPVHFLSLTASGVETVIIPAGKENAVGVITSTYFKDPSDPTWRDDPELLEIQAFMNKYLKDMAGGPDTSNVYGWMTGALIKLVLERAGSDLSRGNIMRQATSLKDVRIPMLLPGITMTSSPTNYRPITKLQLQRWDGNGWRRFGEVIDAGTHTQ